MAPGGSEKLWYLRQVDVFRGLSDLEVEAMGPMMEPHTFRAGELLINPAAMPRQIFVVKTGKVRLFHRGPDGREITAGVVGRGSLIGLSALFSQASDGFLRAEALTEVLVCIGDGWAFLHSISRWPQVMLNLALQLGAQLVQTEQQLDRVVARSARKRLAAVLSRLAEEAMQDLPGGVRLISGRLSHAALAQQIGVTRETVTRLLAGLEADGYIRRQGRQIVVAQPESLEDLASR